MTRTGGPRGGHPAICIYNYRVIKIGDTVPADKARRPLLGHPTTNLGNILTKNHHDWTIAQVPLTSG